MSYYVLMIVMVTGVTWVIDFVRIVVITHFLSKSTVCLLNDFFLIFFLLKQQTVNKAAVVQVICDMND